MSENQDKKKLNIQRPIFWAVASGKGGVGKSFVASSEAITLARMGHSAVLVDFDLSGSNLHSCLGIQTSKVGLKQFFMGETKDVESLLVPTHLPKLRLLQWAWDSWSSVHVNVDQIVVLMDELAKVKAEFVIFDLGSGVNDVYLEILKSVDNRVLVTSPEITSIEKLYRFIEANIVYSLQKKINTQELPILFKELRLNRTSGVDLLNSFLQFVRNSFPEAVSEVDYLSQAPIHLVINSSRSQDDTEMGFSIQSVVSKYYGLKFSYAGAVDFDNAVWRSLRSKRPPIIDQPFTGYVGQFLSISKQLVDPILVRDVV